MTLGFDVEGAGFFPSEVLSFDDPRILKDEGAGFFPSDVLSFEDPRMLKDGLELDVEVMLTTGVVQSGLFGDGTENDVNSWIIDIGRSVVGS